MDIEGEDLYALNPRPETIDETTRQLLVEKARNYISLERQFKKKNFFDHEELYLLSTKFLRRWKVYVGYQEVLNGVQLQKFFGSGTLPTINEDIVQSLNNFDIEFDQEYEGLNVVLKHGLQQQKDFIFLTNEMWDVIIRDVRRDNYIQIKRKVVEGDEGKKVQLYYQQMVIIPINNSILKDVEYEKRSNLISYSVQFSRYAKVEQFQNIIRKKVFNKLPFDYKYKVDKQLARLWLAPVDTEKKILYNTFMQGCKANSTFTYRLYFDGQRLNEEKKLIQYDILKNSILLLEMKEQKTQWCFFNKDNILISSCSNCRSVEKLTFLCSCKFAAYCSKSCKVKDRTYHQGRCPNNAQSQQQQKQLTFSQDSRKGLTGLRNLGNTCFMNSGLQCLSNTIELTEYFLDNKYINDINKTNPLGTKGQLCVFYAKMLKNLWYGVDSSFSPTLLKRAIGKFQPMFSGYNQHDSGQLITYLLDGLHQDLNRVKEKPYVETKDADGRPDHIVANEQWQCFLKRNQSKIVDLMYGQFRSVVDCPKCQQRFIKFDPFCMCSLPLKNNYLKKMQITYLQNHITMHKIQVTFDKSWNWTMANIGEEVKKKINKQNSKLMFYVSSYSSSELIESTRNANDVRSQFKYRTIYVRELDQRQSQTKGIKITLGNTTPHSYYKDQTYRKNVTPYRMYYFDGSITLKQLHHKLYSFYKDVQEFKSYEQQVINQQKQKQPLRLLSIATTRYGDCEYCQKRGCQGCEIPYTDATLKSFVERVDSDKIQFQLYWRKNDKEVERKFQEGSEGKGKQESMNVKKGEVSLQDCLKLFSQPEVLAQDNAYYCSKCQDFVLANKQMQIYKAPKVLILCLKRFKRKQQYFQEKDSSVVDFPIEGLDLSDYVLNKSLPTTDPEQQEQKYPDGPLLYDLYAISNHFGSTGGGHYTAFCKNPITKQWYDCDDSSISPIKKSDLVTQSAYILFYKRRQ